MTTHVANGKIVSFTDTSLVLSQKVKGKTQETSFVLNPSTSKEGELADGATAAVHYTMQGSDKVATSVKVHIPKTVAKAKSSKPKS